MTGAIEHTIILYSTKATVDGVPYSMGHDTGRYDMLAPNIMANILPKAAAMVLMEIDRVTGNYEISAGPDNPAQHESGHCVKVRRQL